MATHSSERDELVMTPITAMTPPTHVPRPNYTDTMDAATIAGAGGSVLVSPAELDRFGANLEQFVDTIATNLRFNSRELDNDVTLLIDGPQITGVSNAVTMAQRTTDHLMETLENFHGAISRDVEAVRAARASYVGVDEYAAQDIVKAGGQ